MESVPSDVDDDGSSGNSDISSDFAKELSSDEEGNGSWIVETSQEKKEE